MAASINRDTIYSALFHGVAAMAVLGFMRPDIGYFGPESIKLGVILGIIDVAVDMWSPRATAYLGQYGI